MVLYFPFAGVCPGPCGVCPSFRSVRHAHRSFCRSRRRSNKKTHTSNAKSDRTTGPCSLQLVYTFTRIVSYCQDLYAFCRLFSEMERNEDCEICGSDVFKRTANIGSASPHLLQYCRSRSFLIPLTDSTTHICRSWFVFSTLSCRLHQS